MHFDRSSNPIAQSINDIDRINFRVFHPADTQGIDGAISAAVSDANPAGAIAFAEFLFDCGRGNGQLKCRILVGSVRKRTTQPLLPRAVDQPLHRQRIFEVEPTVVTNANSLNEITVVQNLRIENFQCRKCFISRRNAGDVVLCGVKFHPAFKLNVIGSLKHNWFIWIGKHLRIDVSFGNSQKCQPVVAETYCIVVPRRCLSFHSVKCRFQIIPKCLSLLNCQFEMLKHSPFSQCTLFCK